MYPTAAPRLYGKTSDRDRRRLGKCRRYEIGRANEGADEVSSLQPSSRKFLRGVWVEPQPLALDGRSVKIVLQLSDCLIVI